MRALQRINCRVLETDAMGRKVRITAGEVTVAAELLRRRRRKRFVRLPIRSQVRRYGRFTFRREWPLARSRQPG